MDFNSGLQRFSSELNPFRTDWHYCLLSLTLPCTYWFPCLRCNTGACFFKCWLLVAPSNCTGKRWITKYQFGDFIASCSFLIALPHPGHCPWSSSFKPHHWSCQTVLKATIHIHVYINLPPDLLMFAFSSCTSAFCLWLRKSQVLGGMWKTFLGIGWYMAMRTMPLLQCAVSAWCFPLLPTFVYMW